MDFLKNILTFNGLAVLTAFLFFQSCSEKSPYPGFQQNESGLWYKKITEYPADTLPKETDILSVHMKYGTADSIIYDSKKKGMHPMRMVLMPSNYKNDVYEGLKMMHKGDSMVFLTSADSFFLKTGNVKRLPELFKSGDMMYFYVKMHNIETEEQMNAQKAIWVESLKNSEEGRIEEYIQKEKITEGPTASGIYVHFKKKGNGIRPHVGDQVNLHLDIYLIDGSLLYSSRQKGKPWEIILGKRFDTPAASEIISMMSKGATVHAVAPSSMAYGEEGRGTMVPPYTPLLYDIEVLEIIPEKELKKVRDAEIKKKEIDKEKAKKEEPVKIQEYIRENNISEQPRESGLYFVEQEPGTGPMAENGRKLKVHYTGMLLDGTIFDSSLDRGQPYEFVLGAGRVIDGWDEGLALMRVGGKARLIIPSALAYGPNGSGAIPPYAPLIFDVELVDME